ncbi:MULTISPECIES: DUF2264 domain-containing protein [Paenibacillus]|uniref:DUF2264 domain-containing protein n=1 Tax=Paenibacillus TaxID=44249 RepID=UPI0022B85946|nr:DUF2264 domain-containing protein [Paenibacillus caseinilyticus]MCZ8517977.1 DUF2264 domain-containing protein [Paenibacillus caseinilyticus]
MHQDRTYWIETLCRIAGPVLTALSERRLKALMPVEAHTEGRGQYTHLEALGRTLTGIAPWLEAGSRDGEEGRLRERYAGLAREAIDAGTDPSSPDYMNFSQGSQPVVDAAFLAHALMRAPGELWDRLDARVQAQVLTALRATRAIRPGFSNWLLFSGMIEAFLERAEEAGDPMRLDYALRQHEQWYLGDGVYGDGPEFHWDYYNSFVIQPMLIDIVEQAAHRFPEWEAMRLPVLQRAQRHAAVLERLISPEGTFPPVGRSLAYRFGAFQLLAQMALRRELPEGVEPAAVRCALTAVMRRLAEAPGTFDAAGWLTIGFCGSQKNLGEGYISTGSLYLCTAVFLPLGLPPEDPFWNGEAEWTAKKLWSGAGAPIDSALYG